MHMGKPHMTSILWSPGLIALTHEHPRHPRGPMNFVGFDCLFVWLVWFGLVAIGAGSGGDSVLGFVENAGVSQGWAIEDAPPIVSLNCPFLPRFIRLDPNFSSASVSPIWDPPPSTLSEKWNYLSAQPTTFQAPPLTSFITVPGTLYATISRLS